jgi:hypothetical protein
MRASLIGRPAAAARTVSLHFELIAMSSLLHFLGIVAGMVAGLWVMAALFFASPHKASAYLRDWLRVMGIMLAFGGVLVLIFAPI